MAVDNPERYAGKGEDFSGNSANPTRARITEAPDGAG